MTSVTFKAFAAALCVAAAFPAASLAETPPAVQQALPQSPTAVQDENFHLLTLLSSPPYREALTRSKPLNTLDQARRDRIRKALAACETAGCRIEALLWTDSEIAAVSAGLTSEPELVAMVRKALRPSGRFALHEPLSDEQLLRRAWEDAAHALNRILRVYGLGETPAWPKIDSISFDPASSGFAGLITEAVQVLDIGADGRLFFEDSLSFAGTLLYLNGRETVNDSHALERRENVAAAVAVQTTDWNAFAYPAIVVLGSGPDNAEDRLSPRAKLRLAHAVRLWREGKAPFLILSGGNVHPAKTRFNEAFEMKTELVRRYGVPEAAIFIEPAARHTTTNFRNSVRLMQVYGLPLDRPYLATSSEAHIAYVASDVFRARFEAELGYQPITGRERLGPREVRFRPLPVASHRDARDPLDP